MQTPSLLRRLLCEEGAVFHPKMEVRSIPAMGGGYGVVATADLPPGTPLVSMPHPSMITPRYARDILARCEPYPNTSSPQKAPKGTRGAFSQLSHSNSIICFLALAAVGGCASDHAWMRPWLDSLPSRYDNLLELRPQNGDIASDAFLRPWLCFQRHRRKVRLEQACVEAEFGRCVSLLPCMSRVPRGVFLWAYNTVMSRGFSYSREVWALMPWVDYFNYALENNATMQFHASRQAYVFTTVLPIRAEEQILLHYGAYTDMELLLWYGFTLTPQLFPELYIAPQSPEAQSALLRRLLMGEADSHSHSSRHQSRTKTSNPHTDGDGVYTGFLKEEEEEEENDGAVWQQAVHRALGHRFSPMADANGDYPPPHKEDHTWHHVISAALATSAAHAPNRTDADIPTDPTHTHATGMAAVRLANALAADAKEVCFGLDECRVGGCGPSRGMAMQLDEMGRVCDLPPRDVLRALCWAELQNNAAEQWRQQAVETDEKISTCGVAFAAQQMSTGVIALLRFIAFDATDTELDVYLAYEEEDVG